MSRSLCGSVGAGGRRALPNTDDGDREVRCIWRKRQHVTGVDGQTVRPHLRHRPPLSCVFRERQRLLETVYGDGTRQLLVLLR